MMRSFFAVLALAAAVACAQAPAPPPPAAESRPDPLPGTKLSVDELKAQMFHVSAGKRLKAPVAQRRSRGGGPVVRRRQCHRDALDRQSRLRDPLARRVRRGRWPAADPADARSPAGALVVLHPGRQRRVASGHDPDDPGRASSRTKSASTAGSTNGCRCSTTRKRSSACSISRSTR